MKFTLLIGSFARGTGGLNSDIDILRVGHTNSIERPGNIDQRIPVSYVDYDLRSFSKLYDEGSLFLYHAFFEGKILSGNISQWKQLKDHFVVLEKFRAPIEEYLEVLSYIDRYPEYEYAHVPYLSNIFKCMKNIGIFRLASKKHYKFEKTAALVIGCGLTDSVARILILSNAVFERSTPITPQLAADFRDSANQWKCMLSGQIKRLARDI